jgi:hypothetical protein
MYTLRRHCSLTQRYVEVFSAALPGWFILPEDRALVTELWPRTSIDDVEREIMTEPVIESMVHPLARRYTNRAISIKSKVKLSQ